MPTLAQGSAPVATASAPDTLPSSLQGDLDAITEGGAIAAVAAAHAGDAQWLGATGVRSIDRAEAARPLDRARVASVTKPMIATLVLQEVRRGRWSLDSTVGELAPGLLPGYDAVTLEQLLSHRSGLADYLPALLSTATTTPDVLAVLSERRSAEELVAAGLSLPATSRPGAGFSYSNTNYVVLGVLLERSTKRPLRYLLDRRVFRPARMWTAQYTERRWPRRRALSGYALLERPYNLDRTSPSLLAAAGAVIASARDLDRFWRALVGGRLLPPRLVATMTEPRSESPLPYGLGVYAIADPCADAAGEPQVLLGHDGASLGTRTLSFSSTDGTRQASVSWTGRDLTDPASAPQARALAWQTAALAATCPDAGPAPRPRRTERDLAELESLRGVDEGLALSLR